MSVRFPRRCGDCLHVVELPAYTEQEKVAIAQEQLLKRPFDDPLPMSAGILALEPAASAASAGSGSSLSGPTVPVASPTVVADRGRFFRRGVESAVGGLADGGERRGRAVAHGCVPGRHQLRAGGRSAG